MASSSSRPTGVLTRITDGGAIRDLLGRVDEIVDIPARFRLGALEARGWAAVPIESANHLDEAIMRRIVDACPPCHIKSLYAVETEKLVTERRCYSLPTSIEGLVSFNRILGLMYCALFPPGIDWLILCTRDEHYAVAGTLELVEMLVGKSADHALAAFREFASDPVCDRRQREFYSGVVDRYQAIVTEQRRRTG